jgi:hypothetical protein
MKSLPAHESAGGKPSAEDSVPSWPSAQAEAPGRHTKSNRRTVNRIYPWLLLVSTATAAAFCLLYITKPVIDTSSAGTSPAPSAPAKLELATSEVPSPQPQISDTTSLLPNDNRLPGERSPANNPDRPIPAEPSVLPAPPSISGFEETNLRIQHILSAEAPGGHLSRLDLEVPVLYQSRSLRWTADEVAEARSLLNQLVDYQEKSQRLRTEGAELLDAWNRLIDRSIPASQLRADSPSLPDNQEDAADAPRSTRLMSSQSIQIQPASK